MGFLVRHRTASLFALVLVAGLLLLSVGGRDRNWRLAADWLGVALIPFQSGATSLHRSAVGIWDGYRSWRQVRSENQGLREELERLRVGQLHLDELRWENQRLRALLGMAERLPLERVAAQVIAREWSGWVRSFTVDRGRSQGVERLQMVIVPDGVVGRVARVRASSALVQLITDPASTVSAVGQRSRIQGLLEGRPSGQLRFKFSSQEGQLQEGEVLVTSGLGGIFPKGLPLGRVSRVNASATGLFRYAHVVPVVDMGSVETVLILTGRVDLTPLFQGK